jgi:hypothetical protein
VSILFTARSTSTTGADRIGRAQLDLGGEFDRPAVQSEVDSPSSWCRMFAGRGSPYFSAR